MGSRTCCPPAPRSRAKSAAVTACATHIAEALSATTLRTRSGTGNSGCFWIGDVAGQALDDRVVDAALRVGTASRRSR